MKKIILLITICFLNKDIHAFNFVNINDSLVSNNFENYSSVKKISKPNIFKHNILNKLMPNTTKNGVDKFAIWCSVLFVLSFVLTSIGAVLLEFATISLFPILILILAYLLFITSFIFGVVSLIRFFKFRDMRGKGFLYGNLIVWIGLLISIVVSFFKNN